MVISRDGSPRHASPSGSITSLESLAEPTAFQALAPPRAPTTTEHSESLVKLGCNDEKGGEKAVSLKVDAGPGCGGIAWPSGEVSYVLTCTVRAVGADDEQVLARYLAYQHESDPDFLKGKKILELGSGTGLVGIAAGIMEPSAQIWVTDQQ